MIWLFRRQGSTSSVPEDGDVIPSALQTTAEPNRAAAEQEEESGDLFFKRSSFARGSNLGQKAKEVLSRQGSNASERLNGKWYNGMRSNDPC